MSCPVAPPTDAWKKCGKHWRAEALMRLSQVAPAPVGVCHGRKNKRTEAVGSSFVGIRRI